MRIKKEIVLGIIVILLLILSVYFVNPLSIGGDDGYIDLNVPCTIQFDCYDPEYSPEPFHVYCGSTTEIMVLRFYDENHGTNYYGNPWDEDLYCDNFFIGRIFEKLREEFEHIDPYVGGSLQDRLWYVASTREQPSLIVTQYFNKLHPHIDNIPDDANKVDMTYDFCESILEEGIPYYAVVWGNQEGQHGICGFGTADNPWGPGDAIKYYNTWTCYPVYIVPEEYDHGDYWFHFFIYAVRLGKLGDINYDGKLNSADVRYLAMNLCGHPDYWRVTKEQGDVNNDGNFNSGDVRYLAMHLCGHPLYATLYP